MKRTRFSILKSNFKGCWKRFFYERIWRRYQQGMYVVINIYYVWISKWYKINQRYSLMVILPTDVGPLPLREPKSPYSKYLWFINALWSEIISLTFSKWYVTLLWPSHPRLIAGGAQPKGWEGWARSAKSKEALHITLKSTHNICW